MNTKIVPTLDFVLVIPNKIKPEQSKTESGIILPNAPQKNANEGIVLAVGPDVKTIKTGNKVIFRNFSFDIVDTEDGKLLMIKDKDIMGVIKS